MTSADTPPTSIGIEIDDVGPATSSDDWYSPSSGRHREDGRRVASGERVVRAAGRAAAHQIAAVVGEAVRELTAADWDPAQDARFAPSTIQVTFGIKLTGGAGKAIEAVMSASGEATMQVVVTLDRLPRDG